MTHLDLFSGIGGFSIGFEQAGFRTVAFAEVDPDASMVLAEHWPDVPNLGDVTRLCRRVYDCDYDEETGEAWCPRCEMEFGDCECIGTDEFTDTYGLPAVVTGGVPCQPASKIGAMRGTCDPRWLWPETFRVLRELVPRYAVFENPPAILRLDGGRAWNGIVSGLAALGYDCWWDVIPAAAVGAGHLRERVFLFATHPNGSGLEGHAGDAAASRLAKPRRSIATPNLRVREFKGAQWYAQSRIKPVVDGLPSGLVKATLSCVGNAVVPEVARVIAHAIQAAEVDRCAKLRAA